MPGPENSVRFVAPKNKEETMKTLLTAAIVLFLAGTAGAADYHIYTDGTGRTVLSNLAPPASARIVAKHDLTDATAADIAATEKANRETEEFNLVRDLVNSKVRLELAWSELVDSRRRLVDENISAFAPFPFVREWNQVAVSVGEPRLRRGFTNVQPMSK
jgi:hypothetical protein